MAPIELTFMCVVSNSLIYKLISFTPDKYLDYEFEQKPCTKHYTFNPKHYQIWLINQNWNNFCIWTRFVPDNIYNENDCKVTINLSCEL